MVNISVGSFKILSVSDLRINLNPIYLFLLKQKFC